jgi:hypothetical protein
MFALQIGYELLGPENTNDGRQEQQGKDSCHGTLLLDGNCRYH